MFTQINTTVPNNPRTIVGDINSDGKADFLQISADSTAITVLFGNGDGTTTAGGTLTPSGGVTRVALGDVNGDGKLDLAIANAAGSGVTVMLGNGDGTFQAPGHAVATGATALALGDVNGDGRADLVTASGGDAVTVRLEQGNGTFGDAISSVPYAHSGGTASYALAVGDVTGDGRADIYVSDLGLGGTFILGGTGDGHFQVVPPFYSAPLYSPNSQATLGDLNGDGKLDVFIAPLAQSRFNFSSSRILLGDGNATFLGANVGQPPGTEQFNGPLDFGTLGDINGDGRLDFIYSDGSGSPLTAALNLPGPTVTYRGTVALNSADAMHDRASAAFNLSPVDGIAAQSTIVLRSNSSGGFDAVPGSALHYLTPDDNGHDLRYVSQIVDGDLNILTVVGQAHIAGNLPASGEVTSGAPVALAATDEHDILVGTARTGGLSNIAVYADTVLRDNSITQLAVEQSLSDTAEGYFSVTGPGGTDSLLNVPQLRFLDGVFTVNPNDAASIVTRLYEGTFGRDPDSIGLSHFTASIEHGATARDIAVALTASAEFQSNEENLGNSDFVSTVYQDVLHRTASASEVQSLSDQLDAGLARSEVILSVAQSGEAVSISQTALHAAPVFALDEHAAEVARLYDTAFGRDPDRAGLEVWRGFLDQGDAAHTLADVANAFAGSSEFTARYGQSGTDAYVTALYQNALHRAPDDAGRAHWNAVLDSGSETRAQVALDFSESAEHQSLLAPHIQDGIHLI